MEAHRKLEPVIYNIPEIATLLDVNVTIAYELAKRKDFPAVRIGRRIVVPKQAFHNWLNRQAMAGE